MNTISFQAETAATTDADATSNFAKTMVVELEIASLTSMTTTTTSVKPLRLDLRRGCNVLSSSDVPSLAFVMNRRNA
jgi:hypothetical protein